MAASQQQQQQFLKVYSEDSTTSINSKYKNMATKESTFLTSDNYNDKIKRVSLNNETSDVKLNNSGNEQAFISESLLHDPKLTRRNISENYEKPVTERETWWRVTIKETPLPSAYETKSYSFLTDILKKPNTYRFKSDGRKVDPTSQSFTNKGAYLMPGAYDYEDFSTRLARMKVTYGFRGPERDDILEKSMLGFHDKDVHVSPAAYNTEKYNQINGEVEPSKLSAFKSRTKREVFTPRDGPPPGSYEAFNPKKSPSISSCFRSKTSRFRKPHTLTPGPGAYWPITSVSKTVEKLGEKGVFFSPNLKTSA